MREFDWDSVKEKLSEFAEKLKNFFDPDNLVRPKNFAILILFVLVLTPLIIFLIGGIAKTFALVDEQAPHYNRISSLVGEELFNVGYYTPIGRDRPDTMVIDYNISFIKNPNYFYNENLSDNYFWVKIHNVSMAVYFKGENDAYWSDIIFFAAESADKNLTFGDYITGSFDFSSVSPNLTGKPEWTEYKIRLSINATHYYNAAGKSSVNYIDLTGGVINVGDLFSQNYPEGSMFGLLVAVDYLLIAGIASIFLYIYLKRRKYRFINV